MLYMSCHDSLPDGWNCGDAKRKVHERKAYKEATTVAIIDRLVNGIALMLITIAVGHCEVKPRPPVVHVKLQLTL